MRRFKDRIVVITGAGSGIGRATARAFADAGAIVHAVDIDAGRVAEVVGELGVAGHETHGHVVDCRDPEAVEALAARVYDRHARCDVLVNNAGVGYSAAVHEMRLSDWKWVLDINLYGVIHGISAFVPRMIDQGGDAHIVNTSSILGLMGLPTMSAYCASKHAVIGLSDSLAAELATYDIGVTAICPGIIATDIVAAARMGESVAGVKASVMGFYRRLGIPPERVARDIVRAVRARKPVATTFGSSYPLLLLHKLAPRLYHNVASYAHAKLASRGAP